ncbi:ATP-binding protein [Streptomyces sp. NPDC047070]|uniref:ATP-binding protein n=1 Tax=Streptomyces sp. NPDC047070 TaxID=3154923 RepID=UPI003455BC60
MGARPRRCPAPLGRFDRPAPRLTSNKTSANWGKALGGEVLASAILDRPLHHCDAVAINGPSYGLKSRGSKPSPARPKRPDT